MSRSIKLLGIIAVLSAVSYAAISYVGGRLGMPLSILALPAEIVPAMVGFCSFFTLLILVGVALVKRRTVRYGRLWMAISGVSMTAAFFATPSLFRFGFRERIKATVSAGELREIARACQRTM